MSRFRALLLLLLTTNSSAMELKEIHLSAREAEAIGQQIWHNEGLGRVENLTVWNRAEAFPSFGIGHFIWYPANVDAPFTESFPQLLRYLQREIKLPDWLQHQPPAPWRNREQFYAEIDSPRMRELRTLLAATIAQQTQFIINRLNDTLPKMVAVLESEAKRRQITSRFYQVAQSPLGVYALIDYVNFKGEGVSVTERYKGQGWGLLQVLEAMPPESERTMADFVRAADTVLTRRVQNAPRDESRWLPGWRKRLQSYLPQKSQP